MTDGSLSARTALAMAVLLGLQVPPAAWGQAAKGGRGGAPSLGVEIQEITVTAQKREENIQEVPISVTALTGETLERQGVTNVSDLGGTVPNLRIAPSVTGTSQSFITLRGLPPTVGAENPVGLYVDGAFLEPQMSNLNLEDLERVEVLRGPQGTLYGRNTIGGALSFVTRKPTEERSITASTEAGNYEYFKGRLTFNVPLIGKNGFFQSDALGTLSLRETAVYKHHDGFFGNTGSGSSSFDNLNSVFTMTSLRWQPTKNFTVDYSGEYNRVRDSMPALQDTFVYPGASVAKTGPFDLRPYLHPGRVDAIPNNAIFMRDVKSLHRLADDGNHRMHILTAAWDIGELGPLGAVTLKSISAYRGLTSIQNLDDDGSPLHLADFGRTTNLQQWSEELQWVGTGARYHYVAGLYYFGKNVTFVQDQVIFNGATNLPYKTFQKLKSYAPFGQFTWTPPILGDRLSITGGIRYTTEQVHMDKFNSCIAVISVVNGQPVNLCNRGLTGLNDFKASHGKNFGGTDGVSPMGDLSYQWTNDVMTYFRVARGFKSGGFNGSTGDPRAFAVPFKPEKLLQYEAGFKTQWFDNRLRLNADGFFSDYTDEQVTVFRASPSTGTLTVISNAGKAEFWGMEFEGTAIPFPGLETTLSYSFIAPKYTQWLDQKFDANNRPIFDQNGNPVLEDVKNNRTFPYTPRHQLTVGLTYTAPPTPAGTFSAHLDTYWQDEVDFVANASTAGAHAMRGWAYALVGGRMQLAGIPLQRGTLDLAVFAHNLFDRQYRTFGIDFGQALGWAGNTYGNPRTFGLQLTYNLGAS